MTFAKKLAKLCAERGWTQSRLVAEVGGVGRTKVSNWFAGRFIPDIAEGHRLARALGVSLDYLADDALDDPSDLGLAAEEEQLLGIARRLKGGPSEAIDRILHPAGSDLARPLRDLHPTDQTAEFPAPRPLRPRPSPKPDDRGGPSKGPGDSRKRQGGKR